MGMYDYINESGDQVKCFYVPCLSIDDKATEPKPVFYAVGGRLKCYDIVPYQTMYYNYGKDFYIVEYRWEEDAYIHVVREGKHVETVYLIDMFDDYDLPPVAIDNYGVKLNINTVAELKAFVEDYHEKKDLAYVMEVQYLSDYNLPYKLDMDKMRGMTSEEIQAESNIRNTIGNRVYEKTMKLFNQKWFQKEDDDMVNLGLVLADYYELEVEKNPDRCPRTEKDWFMFFRAAIKALINRFEHPLDAYLAWCDKQGIQLDKDWVCDIVKQYAQELL